MTNASGTTLATRRYDPNGNLEVGSGDSGYAYTGREWDAEIGLYYNRARYYDPKVARFISEDPLGFIDGTLLYAYASNNPILYTDPTGQAQVKIPIAPGPKSDGDCQQDCILKCKGKGGYKSHKYKSWWQGSIEWHDCRCACQKGRNKTGTCSCSVRPNGGKNPPIICPDRIMGVGKTQAECQANARNNLCPECRYFLGHCLPPYFGN